MIRPLELFVGLRYVRARRRDHFISFISLISIIGISLGIAALITVLSVMNGFGKELRARILGVASHITVSEADGRLTNWHDAAARARTNPHVLGDAYGAPSALQALHRRRHLSHRYVRIRQRHGVRASRRRGEAVSTARRRRHGIAAQDRRDRRRTDSRRATLGEPRQRVPRARLD